jgi:hypothetical protein
VSEELPKSATQIIQARFAFRSHEEAVFRTTAVAHVPDITPQAIAGQGSAFGVPERPLFTAFKQLCQRGLQDIPESVRFIHKMIAAKEVPVVLNRRNVPTGLPEDANGMLQSLQGSDSLFKYLHRDAPDILPVPFLEDGT